MHYLGQPSLETFLLPSNLDVVDDRVRDGRFYLLFGSGQYGVGQFIGYIQHRPSWRCPAGKTLGFEPLLVRSKPFDIWEETP